MKPKIRHLAWLVPVMLVSPAAADVIYSNLRDIAIPATYDGLYLNVEDATTSTNMLDPVAGWDINPYFGGSVVLNSPAFQPVRNGTANMDPILNLTAGSTVGASSVFSTFVQGPAGEDPGGPGYGGSQDHLGTTFTAGAESYLGFKLNGADYGWMRVVFTDNAGGALIKDWAYDDSGAAIEVGGVRQVGQDIMLASDLTLGSQLSDAGGATNVTKSGAGTTTTLTGSNTYTGTTTVNSGTLSLAPGASLDNTSSVTVGAGATLAGSGMIAGATTISGIVAPGHSIGTLNITADVTWMGAAAASPDTDWQFELGISNDADLLSINGDFLKNIGTGGNFRFDFMNSSASGTFTLVDWTGTTDFSPGDFSYTNLGGGNTGSFDLSGTQLNFTVVPEPRAALLGGLGLLALLWRRRHP